MYVYVDVCMCMYMYMYIYIFITIDIYISLPLSLSIYIYTHMYICVYYYYIILHCVILYYAILRHISWTDPARPDLQSRPRGKGPPSTETWHFMSSFGRYFICHVCVEGTNTNFMFVWQIISYE